MLIGLTFYAASSKIYFGHWYIIDLRYADLPVLTTLTSIFRASGRFFWPVGYFAIIAVVAVLAKSLTPPLALTGIALAGLIQWADIQPLVVGVRYGSKVHPELVDRAAFARAAASHSEFTLYPAYHCAREPDRDRLLQVQLIAARAGIPVNGAYLNRRQLDCSEAEKRFYGHIAADSVTLNPLIVMFRSAVLPSLPFTQAAAGFACRDAASVIVCSRDASDAAFTALGREPDVDPMPVERKLFVGEQGEGVPFLAIGWSTGDERSRWAQGPHTSIIGRLNKPICSAIVFEALVQPLSFGNYIVERAMVTLNGDPAGEITIAEGAPHVVRHKIPLGDRCIQDINIGLHFSNLQSLQQLKLNADVRKLSWLFSWFSVAGEH
jgi:hypothetical protein